MVRREKDEEEEQWSWKEGWPQPGEEEKGNGGVELLKGGHGSDLGKQGCPVDNRGRKSRRREKGTHFGGGDGSMEEEEREIKAQIGRAHV